jgi:hypothetical protein
MVRLGLRLRKKRRSATLGHSKLWRRHMTDSASTELQVLQEDHGWWCLHCCVSHCGFLVPAEPKSNQRSRTPAAAAMRSTLRRLREITEV